MRHNSGKVRSLWSSPRPRNASSSGSEIGKSWLVKVNTRGLAKLGPAEAGPLVMKALGGTQPLTWMVNGLPLAVEPGRRDAEWQPDGAGFARVTVMDASGRVATARFRVE